jgi:DNA repair protein RadC
VTDPKRIDELIAAVLPAGAVPPHLRPVDLLDDAVVPPSRVAEKVFALRALMRSGGRDEPLTGRIASSRDVAAFFVPRLRDDQVETLWVVGLDAKHRVRLVHCVARGAVDACPIVPREVLRPLVLNACVAAILVHNHPSGDPAPSPEDLSITRRLCRATDLLGLRLFDHIVVATSGYVSLLDAGLVPELREPECSP